MKRNNRQTQEEIKEAIIKTLCYSDIFEYPLKRGEIQKLLVGRKATTQEIADNLQAIETIEENRGLFFLKGKGRYVLLRKEREEEAKRKLLLAKRVLDVLGYIPTIKLLGISGSLASKNAKKDDDIDIFIITRRHSLWLTRSLVVLILLFLGKKRRRDIEKAPDKICPNMFMSEDSLYFSDADLFVAFELARLNILVDRDKTYEKLILSNPHIFDLLPNCFDEEKIERAVCRDDTLTRRLLRFLTDALIFPANLLLFALQLLYMKRHRRGEVVKYNLAKFHPQDTKEKIMREYEKRIKKYF